ncbi:MAG: amidohydrolase [Chloroflexi bacterium]|nr:MAG: amidohydrolase [Chloroflexota bacterium]
MSGAPADRIFFGGDVVTVDRDDRVVDAVAVAGGRIAAVGRRDDVMALRGPGTAVTDLGGRALLPGFVDAHGHLALTAQKLASANLSPPPIGRVTCIGDLQREMREQIERRDLAPGEWVIGMGYDDTDVEERRHPDRDDLDAVSREHPVVALHVSAHLLAANSRALEVAGISGVTPDPEGGRIRRRDNGDATGVLEETAMNAVFARLPQPSGQEAEEQALAAMEYYASFGATTAQEAALFSPSFMQACLRLSDAGEMPLDVVAYPLYTLARGMLAADSGRGHGRRFRLGGMKLLTDGSIQGYTAYLSRPYHAAAAGREPSYAGFPTFGSQEKLNAAVADGYANGWQVLAHANGDAAIGMVIEAARAADESHPGVDRRTTIIHAQTIREEQLDEVRELGLYVSFFPGHVYYGGDRHREVFLGPERAARINPMRSALDRGIPVTLHHDSPVTPPDILTAVWSAVNRVTSGGRELGPEQRMTPREAVRAVTIDAARQLFEEERKGSIEVGKLADLVLLAANPLTADPMRIREIVVEETVKEGETVYVP